MGKWGRGDNRHLRRLYPPAAVGEFNNFGKLPALAETVSFDQNHQRWFASSSFAAC
jgi:hypothetical protein